jgi:hypothetical protein
LSPEVQQRLAKLKELNDSYNISDEDFEVEAAPSKITRKPKKIRQTRTSTDKGKKSTGMSYTNEIVLATWNEMTDYGKSFRAMNVEEQSAEVKRLNVGTTKGLKGVIKKNCWM